LVIKTFKLIILYYNRRKEEGRRKRGRRGKRGKRGKREKEEG